MKLEEENLNLFSENQRLQNSCDSLETVLGQSVNLNSKLKENVDEWKRLYESICSNYQELCNSVQKLECVDYSDL